MDIAALWFDITSTLWTRILLDVLVGVATALVVTAAVGLVFRAVARRRGWPERAVARLRWPFRWLLMTVAVRIALGVAWVGGGASTLPLRNGLDTVLATLTIGSAAWFLASAVSLLVDVLLARHRTDVADNRVARGVRTQALILRRAAVAAIVVVAIAAALLQFPAAQAAGASLLASAGVVSIIAGLAAQSTLGNVIAGMQLAFSGAIRVDDVVIADGQWGRIEEITLTYVVLHVWDDRRLVLPSTWFTTTPFENWTRTSSRLMQPVDFDLDWLVDPQAMREAMHAVLERTELWDRRVAVLQVTDAVGGAVHIRVLVSAVDAPTLFDLRCFVREELLRWLQERQPQALPRTRVLMTGSAGPADASRLAPQRPAGERDDRELFGGSAEADRRSRDFTGPVRTHPPA